MTLTVYRPGDRVFTESVQPAHTECGDSFLQIVPFGTKNGSVEIAASSDGGQCAVTLLANKLGHLSLVRLRVWADNFRHAKELAFRWATPVLTDLAFRYDVPVDIRQVDVRELRTESYETFVMLPGAPRGMTWTSTHTTISPQVRAAKSFYREGTSTINPEYQVLAFYKGIEGLRGYRSELSKLCKEAGIEPTRVREEIPRDFQLGPDLADLAGKSFSFAIDALRNRYRNAVAHFQMTEEQFEQIPDEFGYRFQCVAAARVLRFILRRMIENDEALMSALSVKE